MGLSPKEFWGLQPREFWIKHRAFIRAEARQRALVWEHATVVKPAAKGKADPRQRNVNALRRYPIKKWLDQPPL